jgi:hypothetical protein
MLSSVDYITATFESEFLVHTGRKNRDHRLSSPGIAGWLLPKSAPAATSAPRTAAKPIERIIVVGKSSAARPLRLASDLPLKL